jgi:hypothetical protein
MIGDTKWHIRKKDIQRQEETSVEVMTALRRPPFLFAPSAVIRSSHTMYVPIVEHIVAEK